MLPLEPALAALGGRLVFVGTGGRRFARAFADERGITGMVLLDEGREAYRALSLKRTLGSTFSRKTLAASRRAMAGGFRQGRIQGDPLQQGGVFAVMPDGSVPFAYASEAAGDHPEPGEVLAAVQAAAQGPALETSG